jgi:hypothetical protein
MSVADTFNFEHIMHLFNTKRNKQNKYYNLSVVSTAKYIHALHLAELVITIVDLVTYFYDIPVGSLFLLPQVRGSLCALVKPHVGYVPSCHPADTNIGKIARSKPYSKKNIRSLTSYNGAVVRASGSQS